MEYSEEFKKVVDYCKENNLFLGYGNPNGKILMIGKEHYFPHNHKEDTVEFYEEIVRSRKFENKNNVISWDNNYNNNFKPEWETIKNRLDNSNAYTAYWYQKNVQNRKLKNGEGNEGTSNTYLHYQKIYQNVFLNEIKQERINFQKEFFITELNDLPSKKSFNLPKLNELRKESIALVSTISFKKFFEIIDN